MRNDEVNDWIMSGAISAAIVCVFHLLAMVRESKRDLSELKQAILMDLRKK